MAQALKGKDPKTKNLEVIEERGVRWEPFTGEQVERLAALGQAISDPIRVRMLGMMAEVARTGRGCCGLPAPTDSAGRAGICVCEFEDRFGMGQSKVSYHLKKLKDSGLVREEKRGKWNYYSVDAERAETLISASRELLLG